MAFLTKRFMTYLIRQSSNWFLYALSGMAIILGGSIYLFLRPEEVLFLHWARSTGLDAMVSLIRPENPNVLSSLPTWTLYSLPGALWAFAYALIITRLFGSAAGIFIGILSKKINHDYEKY